MINDLNHVFGVDDLPELLLYRVLDGSCSRLGFEFVELSFYEVEEFVLLSAEFFFVDADQGLSIELFFAVIDG